jgi:hypothetical protein
VYCPEQQGAPQYTQLNYWKSDTIYVSREHYNSSFPRFMSKEMRLSRILGTAALDTDVSIVNNGPNCFKPSLSFWCPKFSNGRLRASHLHNDSDSGLAGWTKQMPFPWHLAYLVDPSASSAAGKRDKWPAECSGCRLRRQMTAKHCNDVSKWQPIN